MKQANLAIPIQAKAADLALPGHWRSCPPLGGPHFLGSGATFAAMRKPDKSGL